MCRLTNCTTFSGSSTAECLAVLPTTGVSPSKYTTDGVVYSPSRLGIISATPWALSTATAELVVPRSMPRIRITPPALSCSLIDSTQLRPQLAHLLQQLLAHDAAAGQFLGNDLDHRVDVVAERDGDDHLAG